MQYDGFDSCQDFLDKMDAGEIDGQFSSEVKKLTKEQLEQVVEALMDREEKRQSS